MTLNPTWYSNPQARTWRCPAPSSSVATFHESLDSYTPTPLVELPDLATQLGVGRVFVKDESARMNLGAFKILGASWAIAQAITGGASPQSLTDVLIHVDPDTHLVAATDGNHGRAVAHMATILNLQSTIFVPNGVAPGAISNIAAEGAEVISVDGDYDAAVMQARHFTEADAHRLLIQDMSWPGYQEIPHWIIEGYTTLCAEVDHQLSELGLVCDVVVVPVGVGSLLESVTAHYRSANSAHPTVLSVEPLEAACVLQSLHAGKLTSVKTGTTIMAGMNCGTPSSDSWPTHHAGVDAAIAIADEATRNAMTQMAEAGIDAGPCGAATLAALKVLAESDDYRRDVDLGNDAVVVLLSTESTRANPAQ
ncbi:MAG: diaminopropionate ammonia-lyase [Actinobacteria bacterium]|uniref:Unannotated protein n=1 Tax=freshwater metagenome TaxID=449393 RepID=A0A6J5Z3J3_9ZZZZ|nr:diaminopropionate ammonia-lyase [Actinomycetota bacterium]